MKNTDVQRWNRCRRDQSDEKSQEILRCAGHRRRAYALLFQAARQQIFGCISVRTVRWQAARALRNTKIETQGALLAASQMHRKNRKAYLQYGSSIPLPRSLRGRGAAPVERK